MRCVRSELHRLFSKLFCPLFESETYRKHVCNPDGIAVLVVGGFEFVTRVGYLFDSSYRFIVEHLVYAACYAYILNLSVGSDDKFKNDFTADAFLHCFFRVVDVFGQKPIEFADPALEFRCYCRLFY